MKNKKQILPILRALILISVLMPNIEISAHKGGRTSRSSAKTGGHQPIARPNGRRPTDHRPSVARPTTGRLISRTPQQPGARPNTGQRPGSRPGQIPGKPEQPGNRPNRPGGRPDHRPNRPGRRPINIYSGYGYGGYYNGYYDTYGYNTVGNIKYAILDKIRGSAPEVYCSQACSEQHGLNWNEISWCDETACYCECSI